MLKSSRKKMGKGPVDVMSLDSEDDLEIVSEKITNYGNCPTPVEVAPELQEKIRLSLEKLSSIPGKIKAIKVYATKRSKNEMGTIRASFTSADGKLGQVVNVESVFNGIYNNKGKTVTNNNFGNKRKHIQSLTTHSKTTKTAEELPKLASKEPSPVGQDEMPLTPSSPVRQDEMPLTPSSPVRQEERPLTPSSPVILYSPIHKGKQCPIRNQSPENVMHSNQTPCRNGNYPNLVSPSFPKDKCSESRLNFTHPPENSSEFHHNLIPMHTNVSLLPSPISEEESKHQDISEIEMNASENIPRSQMKTHEPLSYDPLLLDERDNVVENVDFENLFVNIRGRPNPVELSPIKFSSDEEEEFKFENSIFDIWSSPKSSHEESPGSFPEYELEKESSIEKEDDFYSIDDMLDDMDLDNSFKEKTEKKYDDHEDSTIEVVKELINKSEPEIPKQNIHVEQQCKEFSCNTKITEALEPNYNISKFLKVDIERLPKRMLELPEEKTKSSDKTDVPPLWSTIFPPSPPPLPPPGWMASDNLWQLDVTAFGEVTGLCGMERAAQMRRKINAPKPRVLRKRR